MSADELSPASLLRLPMPTMDEGGNDEEVEGLGPSSSPVAMNVFWHPSMFREVVAL